MCLDDIVPGDRIVVTKCGSKGGNLIGLTGTVVHIFNFLPNADKAISVEFDRYIYGHSCGGSTRWGYGWNLIESDDDDFELITPHNDISVSSEQICSLFE